MKVKLPLVQKVLEEMFLKAGGQREGAWSLASETQGKVRMRNRSKINFYAEEEHSQDMCMPTGMHAHAGTNCLFKSHLQIFI